MKPNLYNNISAVSDNQSLYDNFNEFIFSNDRNVFNKMMYRHQIYNRTKHLHGDILECGVFKGSGLFTWLKLLDMYEPNSLKKVIGLDFFGNEFVDTLTNDIDKQTMKQVFDRDQGLQRDDISIDGINAKILSAGFDSSKYELIRGDVSETSKQISESRPGMRISILYLDLDLEKPTYDTVSNLWDKIVPGGMIVFDEYGYHSWGESNAVDQIVRETGLKLHNTGIKAPTAYLVKS